MSQLQINHSNDLKQLRDEGYQVEIYDGQVIAHHIPYVNSNQEVLYASLLSDFNSSGNKILPPRDHVMKFSGDYPCNKDGSPITAIKHSQPNNVLSNGLVVKHSFSNKPQGGFSNFYDKFTSYIRIISAPALSVDQTATAQPYAPIPVNQEESVFKYCDTNSSRANIDAVNDKLRGQKIAIVGLGGTGSYILDSVAKTCVKEIHLFDGDVLLNHNAFRCPGAVSLDELESRPMKVDYYASKYGELRRAIVPHSVFIKDENIDLLLGFDYVFLCIDNNRMRFECIKFLIASGQSFIDVGFGVNTVDTSLIGTMRVTVGTKDKNDHIEKRIPQSVNDDNDYSTNIQVAELNALNATLAVIKWKKMSGFYQDLIGEHHCTYSLNDSNLIYEDN